MGTVVFRLRQVTRLKRSGKKALTSQSSVCPIFRLKELTCDSCLSITRLVAALLGQEDRRVDMVEYLASDFCLTGVPEDDMEFCDVSDASV